MTDKARFRFGKVALSVVSCVFPRHMSLEKQKKHGGGKERAVKNRLFAGLLCLCLLLCACASEKSIVGVWSGSGTVSVLGVGVKEGIVPVETWTFHEDGTAKLEISLDEKLPAMEFTYTYADGILTLSAGSRSVEIPCEQTGDTLLFDPEAEAPGIFTRAG